MMRARSRPIQFFSDEYLTRCREMSAAEVLEFLDGFRLLHDRVRPKSRLISIKIQESLLEPFRSKCRLEGVRYQTQIKHLMSDWLRPPEESGSPRYTRQST